MALEMTGSPGHRKPGRPRRSAEQQTDMRNQVTAIAARLFREEGFDAVSMRRIATEAGVSTMSLYMYFPSKNEILRSIWEGFFDACFAAVEADVAVSGDNPRVKLAAACHAYVRYWIEHPDQYRAIYMIEDRVEEHERYFVDTSPIMSRFTVFIDLLQASRRGAAETRETLSDRALGLVCGLNGICHMLVTVSEYDWPPAARLVESLLRMVD